MNSRKRMTRKRAKLRIFGLNINYLDTAMLSPITIMWTILRQLHVEIP